MAKIVNSWNEWGTLKRVVLGSAEGAAFPAPEPAQHYNSPAGGIGFAYWGMFPQEMVDEACEQQDGFAKVLQSRGVTVDRVVVHKSMLNGDSVNTPDWTQINQRNAANPRDLSIVMGNEIIEAPGCSRQRFYEYLYMRPLFEKYFKEDPNARWTSAPRPRLTDASYVPNYFYDFYNEWNEEEKVRRYNEKRWQLTEQEPLWDAADMIRAGKDIFLQPSSVNNALGRSWLKRHLTGQGFRLHEVRFDSLNVGHYQPWHIDASLVFPCPGMAIWSPVKPIVTPEVIDLFRKNDWEIIDAAHPVYKWNDPLSLCGWGKPTPHTAWISMNVLSVDPKTICVDKNETAYCEQLNKLGFEVLPIAFDKLYKFGGMLHCNTLDIYREGGCEDYFPVQVYNIKSED